MKNVHDNFPEPKVTSSNSFVQLTVQTPNILYSSQMAANLHIYDAETRNCLTFVSQINEMFNCG